MLITSIKDPNIALARELSKRSGRIKHKKILLEGSQAIRWAVEHHIQPEFVLLCDKTDAQTLQFYKNKGIKCFSASEGILKKVTNTKYLIPEIAVANLPRAQAKQDFVLVLDDVKDFGNIGTIVRTASAFGVTQLLSTSPELDLFYKKTIEASRGKVFAASLKTFSCADDTVKFLKKQGFQIVATSPYGSSVQSLLELDQRPVALVAGNESTGISEAITQNADHLVQIPMSGQIESLNVGVATGISLYELKLKQVLGMIEKKIKSTLGREVNVAGMLIKQALDKELSKTSKLSSLQVVFLMVLKCDTHMLITHMQTQFGVQQNATEEFLAPLVQDQLINVENNSLTITQNGVETIAKLWTIVENTEEKIMDGLSPEEKQQIKSLLKKIQNNCTAIINN